MLGLRDEGRLDLDDPVAEHLPGRDLPGVRLRELLGHAAGMQREPDGLWWERNPASVLVDLLAGVTAAKLAFGRYHRFHYSNLAYGLLGGGGRLTGQSWSEAVPTRLLNPLGMHRTSYQAEEPFARGYVVHPWHHTLREEPREDAGAMAPGRASSGPQWTIWPAGPPRSPAPDRASDVLAQTRDRGRNVRASGARRPRRLDRSGTAWACSCGGG